MLSVNLKSVKGNSAVLTNIIFELKRKEILAIVGPNGVGKTTLLNSLLLVQNGNYTLEGSIKLLGTEIIGANENELIDIRKKQIKYIFQDTSNCFDPLRKLAYYFNSPSQMDELEVYLKYFLLPPSENILNRFPSELSIGSAQRVAIIWGLLAKTPLLLLDEPTSALDGPLINLLSHKLKSWCEINNSAILLVTQNIEFAAHTANSVAVLTSDGLVFNHSQQISEIEYLLTNSSKKSL